MTIDANNRVVQLCTSGMQAEGEGRIGDAKDYFTQAWDASTNDYEACVAAHYLARHQETNADTLRWNELALERAARVPAEQVESFMPSLLLNVGHSHELLGARELARSFFERAAAALDVLPAGRYGDVVRDGVARAIKRTGPGEAED